ncbi:MAG: hypothetical protein REI09_05165 [Candidatus Dactylopiibacterium sp.]|nr:hypothetical protein [Candidatus Dactylopiibacterium sp.]
MSEPTTTTAAGYAISAGMITITGGIIGMQYDALLAALTGALFALALHGEQLPPWRLGIWLVTSVMIAAWASPALTTWLVSMAESLQPATEALRLTCAALIGAGSKSLIPAVMGRAARTIEGGQ